MELNKENLKTVPKGDIIFSKDNIKYTFKAITGDIVVLMSEELSGIHLSLPISYLINAGYKIKDKVEYYNGWECRSYEGENVYVFFSDSSVADAIRHCQAARLCTVSKDGFKLESGLYHWKYAVQLTLVNTKQMKVK